MSKEVKIVCKNKFKNTDKKKLENEYNRKWIKLINEIEKNNKL